ncbi:hypothetical protein [Saccharopolyspora rosea]|uniref:ANTAR domain-containing protein n=1 Tax=Saccharopolyspora rosea TaxID=524884 RepID=A0ABW3FQN8_9PSEU|nr:hypothetical protein [Saccharopolyspora rosea]
MHTSNDETTALTDALDQVLFHISASLSNRTVDQLVAHLEAGRELAAARMMAEVAAASHLALSEEDRDTLRTAIGTHGGDTAHIDRLDARAAAEAPTVAVDIRRLRECVHRTPPR